MVGHDKELLADLQKFSELKEKRKYITTIKEQQKKYDRIEAVLAIIGLFIAFGE